MKNYILMTIFILATFISIESNQVFAADSCVTSLITDERLESLSNEAKDMIFISLLISSQFPSTKFQVNFAIMLLSHFTEVRAHGQSFSLIDKTLFGVFKDLLLLKDIQQFLLNQLGLSIDNLGPFVMREGGGLILHLVDPPNISTIIHQFRYNAAINMFLDKVNSLEDKEGLNENLLTFSEFLFLMGPMHPFLSKALDGDRKKVRYILSRTFNKLRRHQMLN